MPNKPEQKTKPHHKFKKVEFSKIILVCAFLSSLGITIYSCLYMWKFGDSSPSVYLIPGIFGELATATGFYYAKAKAENEIKISKGYAPPEDPAPGETNQP